ncbi:MAG: hypothetical protein MJZ66_00655 [Bacteroidales bacterium]|nr:hypothetical protein [Bacteroidales bacterium]
MTSVDTISRNLEDNRTKVYKKDYSFFNLGSVLALAKVSDAESCQCKRCQANMERLAQFSETYPDLIAMGEAGKRNLEDGLDDIFQHLAKEHGYSRKGWYKSLYGAIGLGVGLLAGILAALLASDGNGRVAFAVAATIPLVAGYAWGGRKDFLAEKAGKIV